MKRAALIVMAVAVAVMFAVPAFAAESTPCNTCAKPCNTCAKPCAKPCNTCAKPCNTCSTPCSPLPCVKVNWQWPTMQVTPCAPCAKPCAPRCVEYKRDVLGQKVPVQTTDAGTAMNDTATKYESTLLTGNL